MIIGTARDAADLFEPLFAETAANLGIRLHDHLIFAGRSCRSFRALGLL